MLADAAAPPIKIGDVLTTRRLGRAAMRAQDRVQLDGATIGEASSLDFSGADRHVLACSSGCGSIGDVVWLRTELHGGADWKTFKSCSDCPGRVTATALLGSWAQPGRGGRRRWCPSDGVALGGHREGHRLPRRAVALTSG